MEFGHKAYARTSHYSLSEAHIVHSIVHEHLYVAHFYYLVPQIWQQRQCEIAVGYGRLVRAFALGAFAVNVYPLVVKGGIGKHINAFLVHFKPL